MNRFLLDPFDPLVQTDAFLFIFFFFLFVQGIPQLPKFPLMSGFGNALGANTSPTASPAASLSQMTPQRVNALSLSPGHPGAPNIVGPMRRRISDKHLSPGQFKSHQLQFFE
jgi:hypothetical protein